MERKGTIGSKEKREIKGKRGEPGIMEYVSRIVELRYWQPYRLAPLKCHGPPFASPLKKAGAATVYRWDIVKVIGLSEQLRNCIIEFYSVIIILLSLLEIKNHARNKKINSLMVGHLPAVVGDKEVWDPSLNSALLRSGAEGRRSGNVAVSGIECRKWS